MPARKTELRPCHKPGVDESASGIMARHAPASAAWQTQVTGAGTWGPDSHGCPQSVASEGLAQRRSEALPLNPEWVLAGSMLMVMVGEMMMVPFVLQSWTAYHNCDDVVIILMGAPIPQ